MKRLIFAFLALFVAGTAFGQGPSTIRSKVQMLVNSGVTESDLVGIGIPKIFGTWYWVDGDDGSDAASRDGKTKDKAFASLSYAYTHCTSGAGDGIIIVSRSVSGASNSTNLTETLHWTKYGITVVGLASPNVYFGRARVTHAAAYDSLLYLVDVSGQNNTFINIDFYNNPENDGSPVSATAQVAAINIQGARNSFIGCHFNCSPQSANAYKSDLILAASSDECRFVNCIFGSSSFDIGNNASSWIYLSGAAAQHWFEDCTFLQQVSAGTAFGAYKTSGATVLNGLDFFKDCIFGVWRANTHADICASWFIGTKPNTGNIILKDCVTGGFTALDAVGGNDVVWTNQPAANAAGGIGVAP